MKLASSNPTTTPGSGSPLLFSPCTCGLTPGVLCTACARWRRCYREVTARLKAWRTKR